FKMYTVIRYLVSTLALLMLQPSVALSVDRSERGERYPVERERKPRCDCASERKGKSDTDGDKDVIILPRCRSEERLAFCTEYCNERWAQLWAELPFCEKREKIWR